MNERRKNERRIDGRPKKFFFERRRNLGRRFIIRRSGNDRHKLVAMFRFNRRKNIIDRRGLQIL